MKIFFYLMNRKGREVLEKFISVYGTNSIAGVMGSTDENNDDDCFLEIKKQCETEKINWIDRKSEKSAIFFSDYQIAVGWRWLIDDSERLIVIHDSILPKYRGFAPTTNMLINGEDQIGATALFAGKTYDSGDVLIQKTIPIKYPIKIQKAIEILASVYADIVVELYKILTTGTIKAAPQNDSEATYSLWLDGEDYFIDWQWSADKIVRFVNAVGFPYGGAKAKLNNEVVNFLEVSEVQDVYVENRARHLGKVIFLDDGIPKIICKSGIIAATLLKDESGNIKNINFRSRFK